MFAAEDLPAGATATEYVGLLAEAPATRSEDLALYQSYYGKRWRRYCQRYEIGLTGARVADAVGRAKGGSLVAGSAATCAVRSPCLQDAQRACSRTSRRDFGGETSVVRQAATTCDPWEDFDACVTRAGEGEYVLLGKVERADAAEGVAQLINDHTAIRASSYESPGDGALRASDVDGFVLKDAAWPYARPSGSRLCFFRDASRRVAATRRDRRRHSGR